MQFAEKLNQAKNIHVQSEQMLVQLSRLNLNIDINRK